MKKTITITEVNKFKEGNTNGKDWIIFKVKCSGDEMTEFSTFNDHRDKINKEFEGSFQYNEKWKNWQEISDNQEAELSKHEEIMKGLRDIWTKLDELTK